MYGKESWWRRWLYDLAFSFTVEASLRRQITKLQAAREKLEKAINKQKEK